MKPTTENQRIRIKKILKERGSITMLYACHKMGIHRISARIYELRKEMKIKTIIQSNGCAKYILQK